jgi:hypothetical protein
MDRLIPLGSVLTELSFADGTKSPGAFSLGVCPSCRAVILVEDATAHQATH